MSKGLVYILTNPCLDGWVKIGMTERNDIERRLQELNSPPNIPLSYRCYATYEVENPLEVERRIHSLIDRVDDSLDEADASFSKVSKYQITNDSNAQKVNLSDEEIIKIFPLTYKDVCERCKTEIVGFKQNNDFNKIIAELKENSIFAHTRKLNPQSKKSAKTTFYSESIIKEICKRYNGIKQSK